MKLPYGISNFKSLRTEDYLYVDKTMYISKLENLSSKYLFFIRPRRFGKSLFLSTLAYYYDVNAEGEFEALFGDLYIGRSPTVLKNGYLILQLNFSGLNTDNKELLEKSFRLRLTDAIISFMNKYKTLFSDTSLLEDRIKNNTDISSILIAFTDAVAATNRKIYLIIDEYDHFANDIIAMGDGTFYKEIIRASGFVRDFYETVKIGTGSVIDRIFITGISPIMLDDLTSGFNISSNITLNAELNEMLGFTEEDVLHLMKKLGIEKESLQNLLREYYNGYLFHAECSQRLYNPDMILYFFDNFIRTGKQPVYLIDDNVKTDYGRLSRLASNAENRKILGDIIKNESIVAEIITKFSFDRMYDRDYFVSLLFYMGLLTIDRRERIKLLLGIPNYVIKTVFWEYIGTSLKKDYNLSVDTGDLLDAIEYMAYDGKVTPFIEYISKNVLKILSNRDMMEFDEKYIKVILFSYLAASRAYKANSEREVENGYMDIYLERDARMPDIKYEWLLELKYVRKSDRNKLEQIKADGLRQLNKYAGSGNFTGKKDLKQALLIFIGKDEYIVVE